MKLRICRHGEPGWRDSIELRRTILRLPLGLDFTEEELAEEHDQLTILAEAEDRLVGCCVLVPGPEYWKMRQVAVHPDVQGRGIGRAMVRFAELTIAKAGARGFFLHARESAVPFYLSMGYRIEDEPFEEVGLPHRRMRKEVDQQSA